MPQNPPRTLEKSPNHLIRFVAELVLNVVAFVAIVVASFILAFAAVSAFSG